jgi:rhodanese-related sulfurtransferase
LQARLLDVLERRQRAMEHGYARVFWYPDGMDGWTEAGLEVERVEPYSP